MMDKFVSALNDPWVIIGFAAQFLFMMRFVVQWISSERARRSVVPAAFWYFSIGGGLILFLYALHKGDPVFTLGQGLGLFIYVRNFSLILKAKRIARQGSPTSEARRLADLLQHEIHKTPDIAARSPAIDETFETLRGILAANQTETAP
jgi:lipid-A-disaccharide synthase-like uncharacterized protein